MKRTLLVTLATAAALAGCTTLRTEHVLTGPARPAWSGEVRVVMDGAPAPTEYDEIAIVTASGTATSATLPEVVSALQRETAALGGNGVIRVRYDRGTSIATATGVAVWLR